MTFTKSKIHFLFKTLFNTCIINEIGIGHQKQLIAATIKINIEKQTKLFPPSLRSRCPFVSITIKYVIRLSVHTNDTMYVLIHQTIEMNQQNDRYSNVLCVHLFFFYMLSKLNSINDILNVKDRLLKQQQQKKRREDRET